MTGTSETPNHPLQISSWFVWSQQDVFLAAVLYASFHGALQGAGFYVVEALQGKQYKLDPST